MSRMKQVDENSVFECLKEGTISCDEADRLLVNTAELAEQWVAQKRSAPQSTVVQNEMEIENENSLIPTNEIIMSSLAESIKSISQKPKLLFSQRTILLIGHALFTLRNFYIIKKNMMILKYPFGYSLTMEKIHLYQTYVLNNFNFKIQYFCPTCELHLRSKTSECPYCQQ